MNWVTRARVLFHILKWRATWDKRNTHYQFTLPDNPKFMGPRDAVRLIKDGSVIGTSGLGGNQWASILYWAIREVFEESGHPRDLTIVSIGGQGARGRAPGSLEELGLPGLCTRFITGHTETYKSILKLADAGLLELQCIPQGTLALLIDAMSRGEEALMTKTGVGTFIDPRIGSGSSVIDPNGKQWVQPAGPRLVYRMPKINVAIFNAPSADREGNIYVKNCAMIAETEEISRAAHINDGLVIANVAQVRDKDPDEIFLPADMVDAVVVYPDTAQAGSVKHRKYWPLFTLNSDVSIDEGVEQLKFVNRILGITPRRTAVDDALARLAATTFAENTYKGTMVNVGVGLPEEVCRLIYEAGLFEDITLFTESGVIGGLPAPGVYFGAAVNPKRLLSSAQIFKLCYKSLDASLLGMLQLDSEGNVNVSRRGEGAINYVGPGGFIDFITAAKTIFFISSWMLHGKIVLEEDKIRIVEHGQPKFVDKVDEITFSGKHALEAGKRVFYISNVGVFRLTPDGVMLDRVMPGVDIQKDILDFTPMRILLPPSGEVPLVDSKIVSGKGFKLTMENAPMAS